MSRSLFVLRIERVLYFITSALNLRFDKILGGEDEVNWCVLLRTGDLQHCAQSCISLRIPLKFPEAADHTYGLRSRLDHCMYSELMHKL